MKKLFSCFLAATFFFSLGSAAQAASLQPEALPQRGGFVFFDDDGGAKGDGKKRGGGKKPKPDRTPKPRTGPRDDGDGD